MNLRTERKIKFWLSLISKVLIIVLVIFKLIPYIFGTFVSPPYEIENNIKTPDSLNLGISKGKQLPDNDKVSKKISDVELKDSVLIKLTEEIQENKGITNSRPEEKSLGFFIFNGDTQDFLISGQLERTIFKEYQIKPISISKLKLSKAQLLSGEVTGITDVTSVCVGTVSYSYTEKEKKVSCALTVHLESYSTATGYKIKKLSNTITRYGIGFSKEQAKQVAIEKVNKL